MRSLLIIDLQKGFFKEESKDIPAKTRDFIQKANHALILLSKKYITLKTAKYL